jgi:hypothetical protein
MPKPQTRLARENWCKTFQTSSSETLEALDGAQSQPEPTVEKSDFVASLTEKSDFWDVQARKSHRKTSKVLFEMC